MHDRLALAKKRSREAFGGGGVGGKRSAGVSAEAFGAADDDEFIIGDGASSSSSSSSSSDSDSDAGEAVPRLRQIFVCSRTHSQLQQVRCEGFNFIRGLGLCFGE